MGGSDGRGKAGKERQQEREKGWEQRKEGREVGRKSLKLLAMFADVLVL